MPLTSPVGGFRSPKPNPRAWPCSFQSLAAATAVRGEVECVAASSATVTRLEGVNHDVVELARVQAVEGHRLDLIAVLAVVIRARDALLLWVAGGSEDMGIGVAIDAHEVEGHRASTTADEGVDVLGTQIDRGEER